MSKSKGDLLKQKFEKIINRCEEAGNKKAAKVYRAVLAKMLLKLEKKSLNEVPEIKAEAEARTKQARGILEEVKKDEEDLQKIIQDENTRRLEIKKRVVESIEDLDADYEILHETIAEATGDFAIVQEIALSLLDGGEK